MKRPQDSERAFAAVKLKLYQRGCVLGFLITTVILIVIQLGKISEQVTDLIIPFMALFCLISLLLFRVLGTRFLRPFEMTIFVIVYAYYLANFAYLVLQGARSPTLYFHNFDQWIPLLYILAFLIFRSRRALLLSLVFLVSIFGLGIASFLLNLGGPTDWQNVSFLVQLYASNLLYLTMLYIIALLKDRFWEAESRSVQMTRLAMIDDLTGVQNRRKIKNELNALFEQHRDQEMPLSILMLDVDDLKIINDTFGHPAGDYVLRRLAEVMRANVRDADQIGRLSGDEFLIISPHTTGEQVWRLAKRLSYAIRRADFGNVGPVYVSLGAATCLPDDTTERLSKRADEAMYAAKRAKRPRKKP